MNEKLLEKSLAHSKYTFVIIITPAKILGLNDTGLRGTACIYLCTCVFMNLILIRLLRSRIQYPKTLWNRRRGKIGNSRASLLRGYCFQLGNQVGSRRTMTMIQLGGLIQGSPGPTPRGYFCPPLFVVPLYWRGCNGFFSSNQEL